MSYKKLKIQANRNLFIARFMVGFNMGALFWFILFTALRACCCWLDTLSLIVSMLCFITASSFSRAMIPKFLESIKAEKQLIERLNDAEKTDKVVN